jgi:hypothetical protein
MYHATNSRKRSSLRDTRPISVLVGASADALWVEVFLAAARALARFLIALNDVFDPLRDGLVIVRPVRLAMCCPRKEDSRQIASISARSLLFLSGVDPNHAQRSGHRGHLKIIARL